MYRQPVQDSFTNMKQKRKDFIQLTYTHTLWRVILHLLFWVGVFSSNFYFNTISFNSIRDTPATYLLAGKNTLVSALAFYLLMYFIGPHLLRPKKWLAGIAAILLWILAIALVDSWGDVLIFGKCKSCAQKLAQTSMEYYRFLQGDFSNIVIIRLLSGGFIYQLLLQLSLPIALKFGRSYFRQTVQSLQLSRDNLQLEFNFLKAQVNPHFLFNTLNNIYALVLGDRKEQAAATIERLSGFMRYTLYETGEEMMLLEKEVALLKDYIALEQLRLNEATVAFHFAADKNDYKLPTLLLMPALENAFKFTTDQKDSTITVSIVAENNLLQVHIQNPYDPNRKNAPGGIGLQNFTKRIHHYFGSSAAYVATAENGIYIFDLQVRFKD